MTEFEMTEQDLSELLTAMKSAPLVATHCGPVVSAQERANAAWAALGAKMGFDPMTVRPSRPGQDRYFYAKPLAALRGVKP